MNLKITDPQTAPVPTLPFVKAIFGKMLNEERDLVFVDLVLCQSLMLMPVAVYLFFRFNWFLALAYMAVLMLYWFGPFTLMLHNTSHRRLFKRKYDVLNLYIPFVLSPIFGQTPQSYFAHHIGMHHPENNLKDDLSSTMHYQRDRFIDFTRYFLSFFFLTIFKLPAYFLAKKRPRFLVQMLSGEFAFYIAVVALCFVNWRATLCVFILPFIVCRFGMMVGNFAQHAFVDAGEPENPYKNSLTCINSTYNRRCFNDGYHIGHHVKATRHWTELPGDFLQSRERYAQEEAIVIEGVDFFVVWLFLMLKRYDWLGKRMVDLGAPRTLEQRIALLKARTARIEQQPHTVAPTLT